jgi:AraC-like DNA-binding protein
VAHGARLEFVAKPWDACHDDLMQTRIQVERVGPDVPGRRGTTSWGPETSPTTIAIVNGFARRFAIAERDGAFSLKWIPQGTARYAVDGVQHRLSGDSVLILEPGQAYEVDFLDRKGTESFCLFFPESLARQAQGQGNQHADMVFKPPPNLSSLLHRLRRELAGAAARPLDLEEKLLLVLAEITGITHEHRTWAARVPARRPATRRRLVGRLQRAREMIDDCQGRPPSLQALADASALSLFHFLRLFTATYGETPMTYADRRRAQRATELLRERRLTISQIAERMGFESPSAFARIVRRHAGVTPRALRSC